MSRPAKPVIIRANRFPQMGCVSVLAIGIAFGIQDTLALHSIYSLFSIWANILVLLLLGLPVLWMFFDSARRVWRQKFVFGAETFWFHYDGPQEKLPYYKIVEVELHQTSGGFHHAPGHRILLQLHNHQSKSMCYDTFSFSFRAVFKVLAELSRRVGIAKIRILQRPFDNNERELRAAAKRLGELSFDEDEGCFWFTPFHNGQRGSEKTSHER